MKKAIIALVTFMFLVVIASLAVAAGKAYYVCNCGPDCKCDTVLSEPGKCKCGKDAAPMHLLAIEGDTAIFCTCGADCTCKRSAEDPNMCGCGKPVKKVSLKGKYVCACGPDCKCGTISDKPGNCSCGSPMKQVQ